MNLLDRRMLLVREHVGFMKLTDAYDLINPADGKVIGLAWENLSGLVKALRLLVNKSLLPNRVEICDGEGKPPLLVLRRNVGFLRKRVEVRDGHGTLIGFMKSKLFSLGGGFFVFSAQGEPFAEVKGDWKGWNFRLLDSSGRELGKVTKKWGGLGRELFTSADNYMVEVTGELSDNTLVLAASLAIDMVFKERK